MNDCAELIQKCIPLCLTIRGLGHVPSMKNSKVKAPNGIFTKPTYRKWMQACEDSFVLQLYSEFRTRGGVTRTGLSRQSWIAWSVPQDDSVNEVVEIRVTVKRVESGQEGADVTIEPLSGGCVGRHANADVIRAVAETDVATAGQSAATCQNEQ